MYFISNYLLIRIYFILIAILFALHHGMTPLEIILLGFIDLINIEIQIDKVSLICVVFIN